MIQEVKDFIEYNIDLIEEQNWKELFKNWYIYNKDYYFEDMMHVLKVAEPDIWKASWEARSNVLHMIAISVFTNMSQNRKTITLQDIGKELNSLFGVEGQDLINILDQAAKDAGLAKSPYGWYRV